MGLKPVFVSPFERVAALKINELATLQGSKTLNPYDDYQKVVRKLEENSSHFSQQNLSVNFDTV